MLGLKIRSLMRVVNKGVGQPRGGPRKEASSAVIAGRGELNARYLLEYYES